jgi:hypothetical protein
MLTEQEILDLNNPCNCYYYCFYNKEIANIKAHEEIIINSKKEYFAYAFARSIPNCNINNLQQVVIDSNNVDCCFRFATEVTGANLELFKPILENSKFKDKFNEFIKNK